MSPERGDMGARTNYPQRLLDRGRRFKPRGKNSFTDGKRGHASRQKHDNFGSSTFLQQGHKPRSEENKQFDPGGKGEKAPPWSAAVTLLYFSGESWEATCLFSICVFCLCSVCALFPKLLFPIQVTTSQRS